jgi:hypothetical protein
MRTGLEKKRTAFVAAAALAALAIGLTGCGGDDDAGPDATGPDATEPAGASAGDDSTDGDDDDADDDDASGAEESSGGGGTATLTVGGTTYEFSGVLCAFGDETRNEDWDFTLSAIQDGMQLSAERAAEGGRFGDSIALDDIEDFENPSVSWTAPAFAPGSPTDESFVEIDGKNVSAEVDFSGGTSDDLTAVPGTLTATCP